MGDNVKSMPRETCQSVGKVTTSEYRRNKIFRYKAFISLILFFQAFIYKTKGKLKKKLEKRNQDVNTE